MGKPKHISNKFYKKGRVSCATEYKTRVLDHDSCSELGKNARRNFNIKPEVPEL